MKVRSPHQLILLLAILAVISGTGAADQLLPANLSTRAGTPLASQAENDVARAISAHANARSLEEWRNSGFTPEDVIVNVRQLRSTESWGGLCESLEKLNGTDLSLFEDAIQEAAPEKAFACAPGLLQRIRNFWNERSAAFQLRSTQQLLSRVSEIEEGLTSEERVIDPAQIPMVNGSKGFAPGEITITLDDGPHPTRSARILKILKDAGVRANYFEIGENAQAHPEVSEQIVREGHILGSHTWDHANLPQLPIRDAQYEITRGRSAVAAAGGTGIPFFRFPYGAANSILRDFVSKEGMTSFLWNMDSLDWKIPDPELLFENILTELNREKGGVILFHDIHEQTVIIMPRFLQELQNRGFKTILLVPPRQN